MGSYPKRISLEIHEVRYLNHSSSDSTVTIKATLAGKSASTRPVECSEGTAKIDQELIWKFDPNVSDRTMRGIVRVQVLSTSKRTGLTEVLGYVTANLHKLPLDLQWRYLLGSKKQNIEILFSAEKFLKTDEKKELKETELSNIKQQKLEISRKSIALDTTDGFLRIGKGQERFRLKLDISNERISIIDKSVSYKYRITINGRSILTNPFALNESKLVEFQEVSINIMSSRYQFLSLLGSIEIVLLKGNEIIGVCYAHLSENAESSWNPYELEMSDGRGHETILISWEFSGIFDLRDDLNINSDKVLQNLIGQFSQEEFFAKNQLEMALNDLKKKYRGLIEKSWADISADFNEFYQNSKYSAAEIRKKIDVKMTGMKKKYDELRLLNDKGANYIAVINASLESVIKSEKRSLENMKADFEAFARSEREKFEELCRKTKALEQEAEFLQKKAKTLSQEIEQDDKEAESDERVIIARKISKLKQQEIDARTQIKSTSEELLLEQYYVKRLLVKLENLEKSVARKRYEYHSIQSTQRKRAQIRDFISGETKAMDFEIDELHQLKEQLQQMKSPDS